MEKLQNRKLPFEQVYTEFKKLIELGVYKSGDRLPPVREVAFSSGFNPNTVNKAYNQLREEGYIEIFDKKGAFVIYQIDQSNHELLETTLLKLKEDGYSYQEIETVLLKIFAKEESK